MTAGTQIAVLGAVTLVIMPRNMLFLFWRLSNIYCKKCSMASTIKGQDCAFHGLEKSAVFSQHLIERMDYVLQNQAKSAKGLKQIIYSINLW